MKHVRTKHLTKTNQKELILREETKNEEERIEYAKKYTREGFKFTRDMTKLAERAEKAEATNDAYLKIIKDLKQKIGEKKYRERIGGKGKKKNKRRKR